MMKFLFFLSFSALLYTYFGYPFLLWLLGRRGSEEVMGGKIEPYEPFVSLIIPVHNEENIIEAKIKNTLALSYPKEKLEIIVVSDGSTDKTEDIAGRYSNENVKLFPLGARRGKAAALNRGVQESKGEILVFSDASIMLYSNSLRNVLHPFSSPKIGCVSGEDHIPKGGGEGVYGKYELFLRNLESKVGSTVGASGSFYAQRRSLCKPFQDGMAPDFLSVLTTVEEGFRAVTEHRAVGIMKSIKSAQNEFERKVRTFIRGMTTLLRFKHLLNPFRYGFFSVALISHKLMRWSAPFFLILLILSNTFLLGSKVYLFFILLQVVFYALAFIGRIVPKKLSQNLLLKIPVYFCIVNMAVIIACFKYIIGTRMEIWEPSRR